MSIRVILTDIEGTTTDIDFVHKMLFPYAREHLTPFLVNRQESPSQHQVVNESIRAVEETMVQESPGLARGDITITRVIQQLLAWIETDRKHPALKALQGLLWEQGYLRGEFKGHVYPEVPGMLQKWRDQGLHLGVYSSGSVHAQKLLFGQSVYGDLTPLFSYYFDTGVGAKRAQQSYQNILEAVGVGPQEVLFLTDSVEEADAAFLVGIRSVILDRGGVAQKNGEPHQNTEKGNPKERRHFPAADFHGVDILLQEDLKRASK